MQNSNLSQSHQDIFEINDVKFLQASQIASFGWILIFAHKEGMHVLDNHQSSEVAPHANQQPLLFCFEMCLAQQTMTGGC